ncbi:DUF262 domain-containing HNH endonuclease family protein [Coraliomargarita algicola]|uniref:DUF262 domain-containing HNH endonuclease family protein n=1 Tax=Coraliomargarita algicola TaxID=3092156 RepID=A0ABZ0RE11_9BACT|nr:DUF262 domain-containing HNH endonuclease family protein [Coraliomargarita sp. J2-16]WPJ94395.1 DUF262 domain-containing HNH endonuclease family protein [Coraliomargarita sp. J2-16]
MARIENYKYTIEEAFRECFYIVPDYQREYVWTDTEVTQLLEDINEQVDSGTDREYFIGTILVAPTLERGHLDVIDGQQRLTTLFLLLCALRCKFKGETQEGMLNNLISFSTTRRDGETVNSLKLDPRYENAGEVMSCLVETVDNPAVVRAAVQAAGIQHFGSLRNLLRAYEIIFDYIDANYPDMAALKRYWGFLSHDVVFIQISTDVGSALKIFETINERGVGLNPMDLLKNLLFTQVRQEHFTKLKDEWKKITAPLEKAGEKPLRFLRYFLMANYKVENKRGDGVIREDEIYDWLTKKANAEVCGYINDPFTFVRKIQRSVTLYLGFSKGRGNDEHENVPVATLRHLAGGAFSLHYVLLLAVSPLPKPLFDHFVRQLESFLYVYIFTKSPTKDLERSFGAWADELRKIVDADAGKQVELLNGFIEGRFKAGADKKRDQLEDALKRYTLGSMQKYRTQYMLAKLAQHVDLAYQGVKVKDRIDNWRRLEVEHILPNKPEPELKKSFEEVAEGEPEVKYDEWKNRLGNLTLLEKPINIVAGNDFFAAKLPLYTDSATYLTKSIVKLAEVGTNSSITRINAKLKAFDTWSTGTIEERQEMLIALSEDVWRIVPVDV